MVDLFGDYEALDENVNNMAKSDLKQAAFLSQDRNPDTVAESVKLSKEVGMSPEFVESNYDTLKKEKDIMATDEEYDQILKDNPNLSQYLSDPINHATSKDDIQNLKETENLFKQNADENSFYNSSIAMFAGLNKQVSTLPWGVYSAFAAPVNLAASAVGLPDLMVNAEQALGKNNLYKYLDDVQQKYSNKVPELKVDIVDEIGKGNFAAAGKAAAYQLMAQSPMMAVQLMSAYALGPVGSLALMGGMTFSEKSQANRDAGIDEATNVINAAGAGAIEVATEKFGTMGVLGSWENVIAKKYGKETGLAFINSVLKTFGYSYGSGAIEETTASIGGDVNDLLTGVNSNAMDGSVKRGVNAGIIGGFAEGLMTSPVAASVAMRSYQAAKRAEVNRDFYTAIGETIKNSLTRKRLPEGHKAYVDKLTANGPVENIYLDPDAVEEYFQSKDISPIELFQQIGLGKEYEQSKLTGTGLKIKTSDFVSKFLDTEHYSGLANDIKFNENDQTVNQSKKFLKDLDEVIKLVDSEANVPEPKDSELAATFEKQIIATGETPTVAKRQAAVMAKFFETMAEKTKTTVDEFVARYGIKIERGIAPNEVQTAINDAVDPVKFQMKPADGRLELAPQKSQLRSPIGFYSQLAKEVDAMDFAQMPAKDLANRIKNIQGIKKEELDFVGIDDYLKAFEGKVTKQQVLDFVLGKGLQVNQIVLGSMPKPKSVKVGEKSQWGDDPDFSEPEYEEPDRSYLDDIVSSNWSEEIYEIKKGRNEHFNEQLEEAKAKEIAELPEGEELSDDRIDEIHQKILDDYQESWEETEYENTASEDYGYGSYKIEEKVSGETLEGGTDSREWSWYNGRKTHQYGYNEAEAKIRWTQDLIEAGHLKSVVEKPRPDEIKFEQNEIYLEEENLDKLMDEFRKTDAYKKEYDEFFKIAKANDYNDDMAKTNAERNADKFAEKELDKNFTLDSPEATFEFKMELLDAIEQRDLNFSFTITGNNIAGWKLEYEYLNDYDNRDSDSTNTVAGATLEQAKKKAIKILSDIGYVYGYEANEQLEIAPVKTQAELDAEKFAEQNKPTAKSNWKSHSVIGGDNYREILLTLPKSKETFTYDTHFSGHENFVAHVRISDAIVDGKKVLFIEEIQSDWHQQARKHGYKETDHDAKVGELRSSRSKAESRMNEIQTIIKKEIAALDDLGFDSSSQAVNSILRDGQKDLKNLAAYDLGENGKVIEPLVTEWVTLDKEIIKFTEQLTDVAKSVADAPLKQTDAWAALVMKRMITLATEQGYDKVAWAPASVHQKRWGTDHVAWVKKPSLGGVDVVGPMGRNVMEFKDEESARAYEKERKLNWDKDGYKIQKQTDHWLVGAAEQRGGNAGGVDIEETARQRGELLEKDGERVTTKEELHKLIAETLDRENTARTIGAVTERVWKQMQASDESGAVAPRKEGMEFFYNKLVPDVTKKLLAKTDKDAKIKPLDMSEYKDEGKGFDGKALSFDVTDKIKEVASNQGFPLFQQDKKVYQGSYNPADRVIKLFKAKNKTTFMHEAAHFFLDVLTDLSKDPVSGPKLKNDFDKILKFLDVESAADIKAPQHEKFARSFELYLREGKAPSPELKKSFNSFKQWLTNIYRKYTKYGVAIDDLSEQAGFKVELNDEIRGVFDRMLASDAEIAQAKIESEIKPTLSVASMQVLGYTEDEITAFITANEDWILASEGKLYSKMEKAAELRQSKEFKDRVTELSAAITEDLKQDPIYNAIEVLSKAKTIAGVEVQKMKIDPESLENYGVTLDKKYTSKSTGMDVKIIADMFGMDVNDLIEGLQNKLDIGSESLNEATRIAEAEFSEVGLDIKAEATEALHNASREDLIRLEMESILNSPVYKTVVKKTVRRVPPKADVKAKAAEIIGGRIVSDIKPYTYQRAEVKAAREAGIALAKGDLVRALEFKQKEYLNHELYLAAQDANKFVEKSLKKFKKMDKKTEDMAKTRDADLVNAAKAILGKFGIGKNQDEPIEYLKKIKAYDPEKFEVIENRIVDALTGATFYESATMDDFYEMATTVKELMDLAKLEKDYQIGTEKLKFDAVVVELQAQANEFGGEKGSEKKYRETADKWDLRKAQFLSGAASLKRTEFWTDMMDLGKKNGAFTKYFWDPINKAQIQYDLKNEEISKEFKRIFGQYRPIFTEKVIAADEIGFKFKNKAELMMAVLHTGNESNKSKLLRGWGWGNLNDDGSLDSLNFDRMIQRMMQQGIITKADMDFAQEIWNLNEGLKPLAQKAHKQMFGYYFNEITSKEIVTPFGVYKGGYIPAKVDVHESRDQANRQLRSEFEESGLGMSFMYPTTGRGFTKSRIDAYAAPLSLDMNLLKHHVNASLRFSIIEPQVKAVAKLVYNKEFAAMLSAVDAEAIDSIIVPFLQRAASQRLIQPSTNSFARALSVPATYLRNTAALQLMTLNIANIVEQVFGLSIAAYKTKGMPTALFNYLKNARATSEWVQEKSQYMHTINSKAVMDAQDVFEEILVNPNFFQQKSHVIRKYSMFLQATTQNFVDNIAWSAAYSESAARGDTDAEAVQHADKVVRTTQGGRRAIDAAAYEAGTPLWRLFTQFSGYFNTIGNLIISEVTKIRKTLGLKKGAGKLFHLYVMVLMIPSVGSALLRGALAGKLTGDGDDDEDILLAIDIFLGSQLRFATATVPIIGAFVNSGVNKFNKIPFDDSPSLSPVFSVGESLVGIPASIYKGMTGEDVSNKKVLKDSLMMLGTISNLPLAPIGKPLGYLIDVDEGKAKPKNELDFARGLISGQAGK